MLSVDSAAKPSPPSPAAPSDERQDAEVWVDWQLCPTHAVEPIDIATPSAPDGEWSLIESNGAGGRVGMAPVPES